jgi:O-succinylbenzoic acid--CoA ligase
MTQSDISGEIAGQRKLIAVPIPPGSGGVNRLAPMLKRALDGSGPAVAPMPTAPAGLVSLLTAAIKPDDPKFPLESPDIAVVCSTSGSTGNPRGVLLTATAIKTSAKAFADRFGKDFRWVMAMPAHRIAGIMVLTRAFLFENPHVIDPSTGGARPFDPATFAVTTMQAVRESKQDGRPLAVSLVPTQIGRLLESGSVGIEALLSYDLVLSGAAATPQPMLNRLRELGVKVVISYGMTETCGGCVYDGQTLNAVSISLGTKDDVEPGRITISGPVIASGYRLRPDLDAVAFIENKLITHDVGKLDQNGLLHVLGRLDDVVQVGGTNVSLSAVEAILRHHPAISDVAVIDIADDLWGSIPMAYIVLRDQNVNRANLSELIKQTVTDRIGRAATPRSIEFVEHLPMLDSGKIDRLSLRISASEDIASGKIKHPGAIS